MEPNIGDLLKIWLTDIDSKWKHFYDIEWKSDSGSSGSASSEYGFLVHHLSRHLDEVLWVEKDSVGNVMWTDRLSAADPEFFDKLKDVLDKMEVIFKQNPRSDNDTGLRSNDGGTLRLGPGTVTVSSGTYDNIIQTGEGSLTVVSSVINGKVIKDGPGHLTAIGNIFNGGGIEYGP